jgi:FkbM family methyltransferase
MERQRRIEHWREIENRGETVTIEVQPGVWLELFSDSDLCRLIYIGGYEETERKFLSAFLRSGDVFVDVGANIGLYSMIVARIVGQRGFVYAFEPCRRTVSRLNGNLQLNKYQNIAVVPLALSDKAGEIDMTVSLDGFDAWNTLAPRIVGNNATVEKIQTARWDDIYASICEERTVAMMKVDIEGWESRFIAGAQRFLSTKDAPLLQLEFNDENAKAAGSSGNEVYRLLSDLGYRMFQYTDQCTLCPEPVRDHYSYVNLIATKHPEQVMSRLASGHVAGWIY